MEKGFRTFKCHGCPATLKFPVSEKDYGKTKIVRCPKCRVMARIEIPYPAPETSGAGKKSPFPFPGDTDPLSPDFLKDIFSDPFKGDKK